ncbi:retrovirus-related pol polyprotein from transposon TNT 1-94 [Tanacetum coccineum]
MNHQTSIVPQVIPQVTFQSPQARTQLMTESPFVDSGFVIPVFSLGDDLIACLNKAMAFLTTVASSRFPTTNNQLRTSSNLRNQATIQDGRVTVQQARVIKCYNCQGEGHMARQCTQPKRPRNVAWNKEKAMLTEAQEARQILDEEQLAFLAYSGILAAVLMANISNYGSDVISEATIQDTNLQAQQDSMILSVIEQMSKQMINHVNNWEKANKEQNNESITAKLERYKERVKTFEQRLNIDLSSHEKMIDSQMDDMIREKLRIKEQIDSLEQNLSKQIKEKENKYMENEIDLEKKIMELDNIICKAGQSAQTKAQRIKQTLYDGAVMSNTHVAMPMIDDEETLILKEESQSKMFEKAKDPEVIAKKISHKPIDYEKLNSLTDDFGKLDVLSELPNVSLVNACLKKLKFHLTQFDLVVKKRTTPSALEEGKEIVENVVHTPSATTIAPGMFKLDLVPLPPRLLQNRDVYIDYLRHTQEQANTLWELVKQAKAKQPLDRELDFSCKYATRIQELLVYVQDTCPIAVTPSTKKVVVSHMNNVKKVSFAEPLTSSSNIKQIESSNTSDSNTPVLSSTEVKCSTINYGSKPPSNKRNDRISQTPSRNKTNKVVQIVLWYLDSGYSKHMTGNRSQLMNFVSKFLGTVRFENNQIARIMGYGDYQLGNVVISRIYYVEGLGHNLFSVGQFCDVYLEVAFRKNTCFIRNLEGVDLLSGS